MRELQSPQIPECKSDTKQIGKNALMGWAPTKFQKYLQMSSKRKEKLGKISGTIKHSVL
jgi:hypothetical protein